MKANHIDLRLTDVARRMLTKLSVLMNLPRASVIEVLIRERAEAEGILPKHQHPG